MASNSIVRHPRIWKIVSSLKKKYEISVFGWNREGVSPEDIHKYNVRLSLFGIRAPFGRPILILYYPLFWTWIFFNLLAKRPAVVHSIDLDTLIPCWVYKLIFRKKLLYDVHDRFGGYVPSKYTALFSIINSIEEILSKRVDTLVTVSEKVQRTFKSRPKECAIIMNLSEDYEFKKLKSEGGILTLVYTGLITKDQGLERILSAMRGVTGVELILAGRVNDIALLDQLLRLPNIVYKGLLERSESLKLESSSDVMMVLYDLQYRKNQLSSPNKIFEAMMCGIPLITNMEKSLVKEIDCGIIVDYDNVNEIRNAIITLRDRSDLRRRLGENGRKAFVEKYNWNNMEKKLYQIYDNLLKK